MYAGYQVILSTMVGVLGISFGRLCTFLLDDPFLGGVWVV